MAAALTLATAGCQTPEGDAGGTDRVSRATDAVTSVSVGAAAIGHVATNAASLELRVSVGQLQPASAIPEAAACSIRLDRTGGLEAAVAVPVQMEVRSVSGSAVEVHAHLYGVTAVGDGGGLNGSMWSVKHDGTPQSCEGNSGISADARRLNLPAGKQFSWTLWLVVPGAITAADPSGEQLAGALALTPQFALGGQATFPAWELGTGNVVSCAAYDPAAGNAGYIAVVPAQAVDHGCWAPGVGSAAEQAELAICAQQYPPDEWSSTQEGSLVVHNYARSMFSVCTGFGTGTEVDWTPEMTCALVAVVADFRRYSPPEIDVLDNLCATNDVAEAYLEPEWLGREVGSAACDWFSNVLATGVGILAAGSASATGPGAVAVGVGTYRALRLGLGLTCAGYFSGAFTALGGRLESQHQGNVASDIARDGSCLAQDLARANGWQAIACRN